MPCRTHQVSQPTSFNKSFSTSAEREEVSPCTCTVVLLGKGAISSVVHMLFFLCRQWRFPPSPPTRLATRFQSHRRRQDPLSTCRASSRGVGLRFPISIKKTRMSHSILVGCQVPLPISSSPRDPPFRLPRRMCALPGKKTKQSPQNGAHWAKKRPRTTAYVGWHVPLCSTDWRVST